MWADLYEYGARSGPIPLTPGKEQQMIFGYLDAGSGSLILQAILGGAAGILVAFKAWKARLMGKEAVVDADAETDERAVTSES